MTFHKLSLGLVASIALTQVAAADYINGRAWSVPASTAVNAPTLGGTPGPGATEWATFTANGIDFSGDAAGAYNLGGFLNSGGVASNITYMNGASASTDLDNTLWEFTGSAFFTNGETFNVVHDDGINLYVNGAAVLLAGGPTGPVPSTFTYTGPTGLHSFDFIYVECCGGTADFATTLVPSGPATGSTPEPGAGLLLGVFLLCGVLPLWKRLTRNSKVA
jgi:hypothetical protein